VRDVLVAAFPQRADVARSKRFGDHFLLQAPRPAADGGFLLVGHRDTVSPAQTLAGYRRDGALGRGPGVEKARACGR
jgi:glutamate carboxypeptidase